MADTECITDIKRLHTKNNSQFIEQFLEQRKKLNALYAEEKGKPSENPRLRDIHSTIDISKELKLVKAQQFLDKKRSQQLRENTPELKELCYQLRKAAICNELDKQRKDLEGYKMNGLKRKFEDDIEFEKQMACDWKRVYDQEMIAHKKKIDLRNSLLQQIHENTEMKKQKQQEVLKDRENMNKLLLKMAEEEKAEQKVAEKRREICIEEMQENARMMEERKVRKLFERINETEIYFETMKRRDELSNAKIAKKQAERVEKERLSDRMGQQVYEIKTEKDKREKEMLDLLFEERVANEEVRYNKSLEKLYRQRMQLRFDLLHREQSARAREIELEKKADEIYLEHQAKMLEEYEKRQQVENEKRKLLNFQLQDELREMIRKNQQKRFDMAHEQLRNHEIRLEAERKKQKEIDDERMRLLAGQPIENLRFLPSGIIRKTEEKLLNIKLH